MDRYYAKGVCFCACPGNIVLNYFPLSQQDSKNCHIPQVCYEGIHLILKVAT